MSLTVNHSASEQDLLDLISGGEAAEMRDSIDFTLELAVYHSTIDLKPEDKNRLWKVKVLMDKIGNLIPLQAL